MITRMSPSDMALSPINSLYDTLFHRGSRFVSDQENNTVNRVPWF